MISVLNYGVGNIGSLLAMYAKLGIPAAPVSGPEEVADCRALILPGVGHFDAGMTALEKAGLVEAVREAALVRRIPLLGICLGMQMLADAGEEGVLPGLGLVPGRVVRFSFAPEAGIKVPNMGWLDLARVRPCALFPEPALPRRFYFVHSYHMQCEDAAHVAATAEYGVEFTAAVNRDNIWGTQFHPEKSHRYGMALLAAFAGLAG